MTFCPSCGDEIEPEWSFCMYCGTDVSDVSEPTGDSVPDSKERDTDKENSEFLHELDRAVFKQKIRSVDPYEFEKLVGDIWKERGWEVDISQQSQDKGIDITANKEDQTELIQVKRYSVNNKVGSSEVRKYATLYQQESNIESVVIVTASSFTQQATELATDLDIRTVNGDELYNMVQETDIIASTLEHSDKPQQDQTNAFSATEFINAYEEFNDINQKIAKEVMTPASTAADFDGVEAQFARNGNAEQLQLAIEMRNEWAEIISNAESLSDAMEPHPDRIPHNELSRLISEQIETQRDLAEAYRQGLTYKDKLINSRFEINPINPGDLSQVEVPSAAILSHPTEDIEELKQSQDVYMTIAAKETSKIGDLSNERTKIINQIGNEL